MKKKQKRSSLFPVLLIGAAAAAVVVAFGLSLNGCRDNSTALIPSASATPPSNQVFPDPLPTATAGGRPTIFTPTEDPNGHHLTAHPAENLPDGPPEKVAAAALNKMAELKNSPLPPGTHAKSVIFGKDGIATVDFNSAFKTNFAGGDEKEALTLNAVFATLGQFPHVKQVQILVEGKKISSLGMEDLTEPLDVPQSIPALTVGGGSGGDSQPTADTGQNSGQ